MPGFTSDTRMWRWGAERGRAGAHRGASPPPEGGTDTLGSKAPAAHAAPSKPANTASRSVIWWSSTSLPRGACRIGHAHDRTRPRGLPKRVTYAFHRRFGPGHPETKSRQMPDPGRVLN